MPMVLRERVRFLEAESVDLRGLNLRVAVGSRKEGKAIMKTRTTFLHEHTRKDNPENMSNISSDIQGNRVSIN